jgi:hypothetical protein
LWIPFLLFIFITGLKKWRIRFFHGTFSETPPHFQERFASSFIRLTQEDNKQQTKNHKQNQNLTKRSKTPFCKLAAVKVLLDIVSRYIFIAETPPPLTHRFVASLGSGILLAPYKPTRKFLTFLLSAIN